VEKRYKTILIDWDDTIGDFNQSAIVSLHEIFETYHLGDLYESFEQFYAIYHTHNLQLWEQYGRKEISKKYLNHNRFLYPLMQAIGRGQTYEYQHLSLDDTAERIAADFLRLTTEHFRVLPEAKEVVPYLAQHYSLIVISNGFTEVQHEKIKRSGLAAYFDHVVLSEAVGFHKPSPEIYQAALALSHCSPREAVMIGDGYESDIQGAKNAGIDQIWLTQNYLPEQKATYIISSLNQVMQLL